MSTRPLDHLAGEPHSAVGRVRRLVDGQVEKEAEFAYLAPDRWRVRHASGREVISVGPQSWQRPQAGADWHHGRAEGGASVHHTGFLRTVLLPRRHPLLTDDSSRVVAEEPLPGGGLRIRVDHLVPERGTMVLDVGADGRLLRIAGTAQDRAIEIDLVADYDDPPPAHVFDPSVPWPPADEE